MQYFSYGGMGHFTIQMYYLSKIHSFFLREKVCSQYNRLMLIYLLRTNTFISNNNLPKLYRSPAIVVIYCKYLF